MKPPPPVTYASIMGNRSLLIPSQGCRQFPASGLLFYNTRISTYDDPIDEPYHPTTNNLRSTRDQGRYSLEICVETF